ncbi:hypothetical protein PsorP6_003305 [Peronosclerospora sorghi]|uniref:Uncharacterized protein n=1 Tax=Peronosclerospora sorghi TaxID=230839 RepID=A0ACC0VLC4_9STRA|nr:hypothetical protein PsorP6_003305 [Peronosclerospora sorghi]
MSYRPKRNRLCDALQAYNWRPIIPEGGYFVCCNVEGLPLYDEFRDLEITSKTPKTEFPDYQFAYKLVKACHLAVIQRLLSSVVQKTAWHEVSCVLRFAKTTRHWTSRSESLRD